MELADFSRYRKAVIATSAIGFVLFASGVQQISWAGIDLNGILIWICLGMAHSYFMLMFWLSDGFRIITTANISSTTSYGPGNKSKIGKALDYRVPRALAIVGAVNIAANFAVQLLRVIEDL